MRRISSVAQGSIAQRHRLMPGDIVLSINGEPVEDEIDYQALTARRHVRILLAREDGEQREVDIVKTSAAALGLQFDDSIIGNPKTCTNNCLFCFVEQMPKGMRQSLYLKDDDWRLSLLMGNYITLTNISKREFERVLRRKASPLYVSVHATDPELRARMLGNQNGARLMERLARLKEANLHFHCQLVLCPGMNDGEVLIKSLQDLKALYPAALSVALVPVGLTRYRENLEPIRPYTKEEAKEILEICYAFQQEALLQIGTRFAFPADELICIAGAALPLTDSYEHFAQIENGVGMLRQFEDDLRASYEEDSQNKGTAKTKSVLLPCGTALAPYLNDWVLKYKPAHVNARVIPIHNDFFGETVTVSGLICAQDLIAQLVAFEVDEILIVDTMLNNDNTLFLDDLTPDDLQATLGIPVRTFHNTGKDFYQAMALPLKVILETE